MLLIVLEYIVLMLEFASPGTSKSSPPHFTLPESMEDLRELGITEEFLPFSDKCSSGNSKPIS